MKTMRVILERGDMLGPVEFKAQPERDAMRRAYSLQTLHGCSMSIGEYVITVHAADWYKRQFDAIASKGKC